MVLPVRVFVILGGAVISAGGGLVTGAVGAIEIRRAQKQMDRQMAVYTSRYSVHIDHVDETNARIDGLGTVQQRALDEVIYPMRDYLMRHKKLVKASEHLILEGVDGSNIPVVGLTRLPNDSVTWVRGIVGSAGAGVATSAAARAAVVRFGAASTGRSLRLLSGATAQRATLAWWGGGSLQSGGGGMRLGRVVQYAPVIGPAILVAGLSIKVEGAKAKATAQQHHGEVQIEMAKLDGRDELLLAVRARIAEIEHVLTRLIADATTAFKRLEAETKDGAIPPESFQRAMIVVAAVRNVATAPIADEDGKLDDGTGAMLVRYRQSMGEVFNG
jgi:hypothetical protein